MPRIGPPGHLWREADVSRPRRAQRAAAADHPPVRGAPGAERAASARVWLAHRRAVTLPRVASPLPAGAQAAQASSNWSLGKRESVPLAPGTDPALHPDLLRGVNPLGFSPALLRGGDGRLGRSLDPILLYYQSYHSWTIVSVTAVTFTARQFTAGQPILTRSTFRAPPRLEQGRWRSTSCQLSLARLPLPRLLDTVAPPAHAGDCLRCS